MLFGWAWQRPSVRAISMGFSESQSRTGHLLARVSLAAGRVTGLMTMAGGLGHTLPFLIGNFHAATLLAIIVVCIELVVIAYIRAPLHDTPFCRRHFK